MSRPTAVPRECLRPRALQVARRISLHDREGVTYQQELFLSDSVYEIRVSTSGDPWT